MAKVTIQTAEEVRAEEFEEKYKLYGHYSLWFNEPEWTKEILQKVIDNLPDRAILRFAGNTMLAWEPK